MEETFINVPNKTDTSDVQIATITFPGETTQVQEIFPVHGFIGGDTIDTVTSVLLSTVTANISYSAATPWAKDASGVFSIPEKAKSILLMPTAHISEALTTYNALEVVFVLVLLQEVAGVLVPFAYFSSPEEKAQLGSLNFQNTSEAGEEHVFFWNSLEGNYKVPPVIPTLGCPYGRLFIHKKEPSTPPTPVTDSFLVNVLFLDHFVGGVAYGGMARGAEDIFFPSDMSGDQ